uniref:hypothetical protein n=1 Tax=Lapillicoccus sp. TaxID=1909287 RepID=UPI0026014917
VVEAGGSDDSAQVTEVGDAPKTRRRRRASRRSTAGDVTDVAGQTRDDTDAGWGEDKPSSVVQGSHDSWLREQRPPHWGRD